MLEYKKDNMLKNQQLNKCMCLNCTPNIFPNMRFNVCGICGNKRCPHATNHEYVCNSSNDIGQDGSIYGDILINVE